MRNSNYYLLMCTWFQQNNSHLNYKMIWLTDERRFGPLSEIFTIEDLRHAASRTTSHMRFIQFNSITV